VYSSCTLIGHVGADPISRALPNGKTVVSFSIAVDEGKDASGQDRPCIWWKCSAWEKLGEIVAKYVHKGSKLFVEGTPTPVYADLDKEGKPRGQYQCRVHTMKMLDNKPATATTTQPEPAGDGTEEIPFR
jgi:single-strand DNA-binding protein